VLGLVLFLKWELGIRKEGGELANGDEEGCFGEKRWNFNGGMSSWGRDIQGKCLKVGHPGMSRE